MANVKDLIAELSSSADSQCEQEDQFCGAGRAGVLQTLRFNGTQYFVFRPVNGGTDEVVSHR
jgi:hypothetical protein